MYVHIYIYIYLYRPYTHEARSNSAKQSKTFTNEDAENKSGIVLYTSDVLVLWEVLRQYGINGISVEF